MVTDNLVVLKTFFRNERYHDHDGYTRTLCIVLQNKSETATALNVKVTYDFEREDGRHRYPGTISYKRIQPGDKVFLVKSINSDEPFGKSKHILRYTVECEEIRDNYIAPSLSDFEITDVELLNGFSGKAEKIKCSVTSHYLIPTKTAIAAILLNGDEIVWADMTASRICVPGEKVSSFELYKYGDVLPEADYVQFEPYFY